VVVLPETRQEEQKTFIYFGKVGIKCLAQRPVAKSLEMENAWFIITRIGICACMFYICKVRGNNPARWFKR
jgi:hypothetical protein